MPSRSPFDSTIAELEYRLAKLLARIRSENPELDLLMATLDGLKALRANAHASKEEEEAALPAGIPVVDPNTLVPPTRILPDTFLNMTIAQAARRYLLMVGRPQATKEIAAALIAGGLRHSALDFPQSITDTLRMREEFRRLDGGWVLSEWVQGVPDTPRPRRKEGLRKLIIKTMQGEPNQVWLPRAMAQKIDRNLNSVQSTMSSMAKDGDIRKAPKLGYILNDEPNTESIPTYSKGVN